MQNRSEAYDFGMFAPKQQPLQQPHKKDNIIELPQKQLQKNRRAKLHPFRVFVVSALLVVMLGVVGTMVYGQVQLTELTENINAAQKQLEESQSVHTQLEMKASAKLSLNAVEEYAQETLGMSKIQQSQIENIEIASGDKSEVIQSAESEIWLSSLWNSIVGLLS